MSDLGYAGARLPSGMGGIFSVWGIPQPIKPRINKAKVRFMVSFSWSCREWWQETPLFLKLVLQVYIAMYQP